MFKNRYIILGSLTTLVVLADQLTKLWIRHNIPLRGRRTIIPEFFRLVHVENKGAAWGLMAESSYRIPFFISATLIAFVVIGIYFYKLPKGQTFLAAAMSLILGGAIGNFIDRVLFQKVTDFLGFYINWEPARKWLLNNLGSNQWPSFNIADTAIVLGLLFITYDMIFLEGKRARGAARAEEPGSAGSTKPEASTSGEGGVA